MFAHQGELAGAICYQDDQAAQNGALLGEADEGWVFGVAFPFVELFHVGVEGGTPFHGGALGVAEKGLEIVRAADDLLFALLRLLGCAEAQPAQAGEETLRLGSGPHGDDLMALIDDAVWHQVVWGERAEVGVFGGERSVEDSDDARE